MKKLLGLIVLLFLMLNVISTVSDAKEKPLTLTQYQQRQTMSPEAVLKALMAGNERFVAEMQQQRKPQYRIAMTKEAQYPIAVILSCMDSRAAPELIFDQGIGDLFSVRNAGNVIDNDVLASLEFATKVAGARLIIVMGHTSCGAVQGACKDVKLGHLTSLLHKIQPAVKAVEQQKQSHDCNKASLVNAIARQNVLDSMAEIQKQSPIIDQLLKEQKIMLVGAMYDIATGKVHLLESIK